MPMRTGIVDNKRLMIYWSMDQTNAVTSSLPFWVKILVE